MPRAPKACAYFGCENRVVGKSWCPEHQSRWPKEKSGRAVPYHLQQACFKRDDYTCIDCRRRGQPGDGTLHADHIRSRASGGRHELSNIATRCKSCHQKKSQREAAAARG